MTFTGKIRTFLVAVAVLPTALIMMVIYFHSVDQLEQADQRKAYDNFKKYDTFRDALRSELDDNVTNLLESEQMTRTLRSPRSGRPVDPHLFGLDFLEITDTNLTVLASHHRPGLLGQPAQPELKRQQIDTTGLIETLEFDVDGGHAAFTTVRPLGESLLVYTGKYIDRPMLRQLSALLDAAIQIEQVDDSVLVYASMDRGSLYQSGESYQAVLAGGQQAGFFLVATFDVGSDKPIFLDLLSVAAIFALASVVLAIFLGVYITGRAKREIDNLVSATSRVAAGDFGTPVMAYEEGEFSQLADSFSDMTLRLKETQKRLATTEKIAAWQTVGRKIAHEIKNPLTPIGISVDDLRRSHAENVPQFDKVLDETTATIKQELDRLVKILDEFVSFARMRTPELETVDLNTFLDSVTSLYRGEIDTGRIKIDNRSKSKKLKLDPEAIKQVLINLIKNGLESSPTAKVTLTLSDQKDSVVFTIEDTGPGFTEEKLANSFEPYVTTKEGGSGLGLVICHRIVHDHGGTMELYNKPSGGAAVRIHLPLQFHAK